MAKKIACVPWYRPVRFNKDLYGWVFFGCVNKIEMNSLSYGDIQSIENIVGLKCYISN